MLSKETFEKEVDQQMQEIRRNYEQFQREALRENQDLGDAAEDVNQTPASGESELVTFSCIDAFENAETEMNNK